MTVVTLGIYGLYWIHESFCEVKRHRGRGVGGGIGVVLCLVLVGYFVLGRYVGQMHRDETGEAIGPVGTLSGFWVFLPLIGVFVYVARMQGALNSYWAAKSASSAVA
jgi:Domain of unknown function (DUF4234)